MWKKASAFRWLRSVSARIGASAYQIDISPEESGFVFPAASGISKGELFQ
jgi:hypothetical protein